MSLELQIDKYMNRYFEERDNVPDLLEFAEWLYDTLFWESVEKKCHRNTKPCAFLLFDNKCGLRAFPSKKKYNTCALYKKKEA